MARDRTTQLATNLSLAGTGTVFSDFILLAQLVEGTAGSAVDLGEGNPLYPWVHIDESFAGGNFLRCDLVASATAPGDGSEIILASSGEQPLLHPILGVPGPLQAGETINMAMGRVDRNQKMPVLNGVINFPASYRVISFRFIRDGTFTLGKVTAGIGDEPPAIGLKKYPSGNFGSKDPS